MSPLRLVSSVTPAGQRIHSVNLVNPLGPPQMDGDGGYTQPTTTLAAGIRVKIEAATPQTLERVAAGTVIAEATSIVRVPFLAGVTTQTRIIYGARTLHVLS